MFSWSCQSLSAPAARLFRLLGLHTGPDITAAAAGGLAGLPVTQARAVLGELAHSHLLTEHVVGRFAMHDLLRVYSIEQADAHETAGRHAAIGRVLDHYLHTAYAMSLVLDPSRVPLGLAPPQPGVQPEEVTEYRQAWDWAEAERRVLLAAIAGAADLGFGRHAWQIASSLDTCSGAGTGTTWPTPGTPPWAPRAGQAIRPASHMHSVPSAGPAPSSAHRTTPAPT